MLFIFLASLVSTATALSRDAPSLPLSWQTTGRAAAPDTIRVIVALKQRNLEQLPSLVLAVSNPTSPTYGQYLTKGQLDVRSHLLVVRQNTSKNGDMLSELTRLYKR